ncbi:MAG: aminotransferase class V-fold PLP-dependent enzyme [Pedobacter sp.]
MAIYLDNAATTFPKPESVYRAVDLAFRYLGVSPGRGSYQLSLEAGRLVLEARETVAEFFGIRDASRVVFAANATEAINIALFGLLQAGDRVITSAMEHNAISRPLHALEARGVEVVRVPVDACGLIDPAVIRATVREGTCPTRMVVLSHCSNVTGVLQPIAEIGNWCRREGIVFMVDAAQSAGQVAIDVEDMGIDLLAVPGHKSLLGPQGTGALYVAEKLLPAPLIWGGTGGNSISSLMPEDLPERFESGTLNTPALAGLQAGIEFVRQTGLQKIQRHKAALLDQLSGGLHALPGVRCYNSSGNWQLGGVLSFNIEGRDPAEIGFLLDEEYGICVRTGLHCAPDAHRSIGTLPSGTIRVSPGLFNTEKDIDALLVALKKIIA